MNRAFCNACGKLVEAAQQRRDGEVLLVKDCPECGPNESVISNDAVRYMAKRSLDGEHTYVGCALNCLDCSRKKTPTFIFLDITNRCNLNCPICINNTPSMGFVFEPPMQYFDRIFEHFSHYDPPPAVQLFGGEPTVREDLFEIITRARSFGLPTRVVTNGLKLADEDYCRKLVRSRATILIAYDGSNPQTYRVLRGSSKALSLKQKAIENLGRAGARKVALMTCVAKGFNDGEMDELLRFCHERRESIRGVYFLPLAQTWDLSEFDLEPPRVTSEDIELMLDECFPGERIEFVPAGVLGELPTLMKCLGVKRTPFMGAHPNCESMYILASDGEKYVPLSAYLRCSVPDFVRALFAVEKRLARLERKLETSVAGRVLAKLYLKRKYLALRAVLSVARAAWHNANLSRLLKGKGIWKLPHAAGALWGLLFRRKTRRVLERHTTFHEVLQLIVLPFEDNSVLETERLERCPNAFVFMDPADDAVNAVPTCAWGLHRVAVMKRIADYYGSSDSRH